ncbi:MAG: LamG domain-containing protein [Opitutales bacterium]
MNRNSILLLLTCLSWAAPAFLDAAVISYWRFEQDDDPSAQGLDSPNNVAGEPAVISNTARLDDSANPGSLPNTIIPGTGAANTSSLDGTPLDINATAAYSPTLNVSSMTVELWTRTEESTAVVLARSNNSNVRNSIDDGFRIYDTQDLKVEYWTGRNKGQATRVVIDTNYRLDQDGVADGQADWHHIAFTYDAATGEGKIYADGVVIGSHTGSADTPLYWGRTNPNQGPEVQIGVDMDGYNFSKTSTDNGFIDEIRFTDGVLTDDDFLVAPVPEPSTYAAGGLLLGLMGLHLWRRKRHGATVGSEPTA